MNETYKAYDPWAAASNPTFGNSGFWGQLKVEAWTCTLVKGQGKVPFNPQVHDKPATAIDLVILPLAEQNITNANATERHMIAESQPWANITWKSLKALGVNSLSEVRDRWCHVVCVPDGTTYEKNGQIKEGTMFKFVSLFDTENACREDYLKTNGNGQTHAPVNNSTPPTNGKPAAAAPDKKATALQFLKVIVANACKGQNDMNTVTQTIAQNIALYPMVNEFFTADSIETTQLVLENLTK